MADLPQQISGVVVFDTHDNFLAAAVRLGADVRKTSRERVAQTAQPPENGSVDPPPETVQFCTPVQRVSGAPKPCANHVNATGCDRMSACRTRSTACF